MIGYEKNKEIHRNIFTISAKLMMPVDSSDNRFSVIMSLVSGPNDR